MVRSRTYAFARVAHRRAAVKGGAGGTRRCHSCPRHGAGAVEDGSIARDEAGNQEVLMNIALLIIIVVAIVIAIVSGLNASLQWLLWVALIVGVIALIAFLFRVIRGGAK
jgi:hypothetical protein